MRQFTLDRADVIRELEAFEARIGANGTQVELEALPPHSPSGPSTARCRRGMSEQTRRVQNRRVSRQTSLSAPVLNKKRRAPALRHGLRGHPR